MGLLAWWKKRRRSTKPDAMISTTPTAVSARLQRQSGANPSPGRHQSARDATPARWIGPGETIKIGGYVIPGGMLYVGRQPAGRLATPILHPSLIDPALPIGAKASAQRQDMPYWPAYAEISPEQRGTYLGWLAAGRRDPSTAIGYVFLFLYGLERRVLIDLAADPSLIRDLSHIRHEVAALLEIYGHQSTSFQRYASAFLDLLDAHLLMDDSAVQPLPPPLTENRWTVPSLLRIQLGKFAASGTAIPAEWAFAWAWFHPEISFRTPATRCPDEFSRLFATRYRQLYPNGLPVRAVKTRMRLTYRPASRGLPEKPVRLDAIPDVFALKSPGQKLAGLVESVTSELDAYSRWLGRNPDRAGSLAAFALLPGDLLSDSMESVSRLRVWVEDQLREREPVLLPSTTLFDMWQSMSADKLSKADSVLLTQLLGHLGFGIEPDVRFGGPPLGRSSSIALFRTGPDAPQTATPAYGAAMTLVHFAAAVGAADGHISVHEVDHLGAHVASSLRLTSAEQNRLFAHLVWLSGSNIKFTGLKRRVDALSQKQRRNIGDVLIIIAAADGVISPEEVTTLVKIYRMLGLDPDAVTSRLHASLIPGPVSPAQHPVRVRPAGAQDVGYPIPAPPADSALQPPATPAAPLMLDTMAIEAKLAETAAVSALLGDIFEDDTATPPLRGDAPIAAGSTPAQGTPDTSTSDTAASLPGLDTAHSLLLQALAARESWERAEFENLAASHHLMPDGAVDVLNEAAFEASDEPLLEDNGDVMTVNQYALQELLA